MPITLAVIALAAALCAAVAILALRARKKEAGPKAEAFLLEEAVVTVPVAPGLEGMARLCRPDALGLSAHDVSGQGLSVKVRATDASQAFARGDRVRIIDVSEGVCVIEGADQEHRAR